MSEGKKEILLGDCLELMKDIPNGSIDMILCDLPYGITQSKWDVIIPFDKLWEQYNRIIKTNGAVVLFGNEPFSSALRFSNMQNWKYDWIWDKKNKTGILNCKKRPLKQFENIMVFYNEQCIYNPQMTKGRFRNKKITTKKVFDAYGDLNNEVDNYNDEYYPSNILEFSNAGNMKGKLHPTQKPIELFEYLIKTYTNENDLVLDNTAGSGTTAIACLNTNRQFIVMEKEQKYYDIILKRVADFNKNFEHESLIRSTSVALAGNVSGIAVRCGLNSTNFQK